MWMSELGHLGQVLYALTQEVNPKIPEDPKNDVSDSNLA